MSAKVVCGVLGCECTCHRAKHRQAPRLWTPGMDRRLTEAVKLGVHPTRIAVAEHLSLDSVRWRIKTLGLSLRDGWRSRQEVAAVLGVSRRSVDRWMRDGFLAVSRHGTRWTRITDDDLATFVKLHAGVLVEPETIVDRSLRQLAETSAIANRRRVTEAAS